MIKGNHHRLGLRLFRSSGALVRSLFETGNYFRHQQIAERSDVFCSHLPLHSRPLSSNTISNSSGSITSDTKSSSTTNTENAVVRQKQQQQQDLEAERAALLAEAKGLTLSLYRTIVRSVRVIRHGNEHDELEFQARETKRKEKRKDAAADVRLSMLSMLPPVDRVDELRSRAEYYQQYARENFVQESDCLDRHDDGAAWDVARYLNHLRRGEEQRKWLLADMKFTDPYAAQSSSFFDLDRVDEFGKRAFDYIKRIMHFRMQAKLSPEDFKICMDRQNNNEDSSSTVAGNDEDDVNDGWSTDEDDDSDSSAGLPSWYKNPRSK